MTTPKELSRSPVVEDAELERLMKALEAAACDVEYSPFNEDYVAVLFTAREALRSRIRELVEEARKEAYSEGYEQRAGGVR